MPASNRRSGVAGFVTVSLAEFVIGLRQEGRSSAGAAAQYEAVEFATLDWVDCFNARRLPEPMGYVPGGAGVTRRALVSRLESSGLTHIDSPPRIPVRWTCVG